MECEPRKRKSNPPEPKVDPNAEAIEKYNREISHLEEELKVAIKKEDYSTENFLRAQLHQKRGNLALLERRNMKGENRCQTFC